MARSDATLRKWIKELKRAEVRPALENYRGGAIMALNCVLYSDWPRPLKFLAFGQKRRKGARKG